MLGELQRNYAWAGPAVRTLVPSSARPMLGELQGNCAWAALGDCPRIRTRGGAGISKDSRMG